MDRVSGVMRTTVQINWSHGGADRSRVDGAPGRAPRARAALDGAAPRAEGDRGEAPRARLPLLLLLAPAVAPGALAPRTRRGARGRRGAGVPEVARVRRDRRRGGAGRGAVRRGAAAD